MSKDKQQQCCGQCPFARSTPKEYLDTMGQNGERFIGQSIGPFMLPCHMRKEFAEFGPRFLLGDSLPPCAGAAKYRANLGISHLLPPQLGTMAADFEEVFGSHAELLAHHEGTSLDIAEERLTEKPPLSMLMDEMGKKEQLRKPIG